MFIVEGDNLWYSNKAFGTLVDEAPANLRGKTLSSVMGPAAAKVIETLVSDTLADGKSVSRMIEDGQGGVVGQPVPDCRADQYFEGVRTGSVSWGATCLRSGPKHPSVRHLMKNLVGVLSSIVDLHDPFSAGHSMRTALVASAIARELGMDEKTQEALEMSARLANVGKIFLPRELLTKTVPLDAEEHKLVQSHVQHTLALLEGIDFEGPVLDIIAQKSEHLDGSGYPGGLKESELLPESRVLAVANAFVAMVSARAYRVGVPINGNAR